MWLWVKTRFALLMERFGIAWTDPSQVSDGDKLGFVVGMGLGGVGLLVALVGLQISYRQASLEQVQFELLQLERSLRPHEHVNVKLKSSDGTLHAYEISVTNTMDGLPGLPGPMKPFVLMLAFFGPAGKIEVLDREGRDVPGTSVVEDGRGGSQVSDVCR